MTTDVTIHVCTLQLINVNVFSLSNVFIAVGLKDYSLDEIEDIKIDIFLETAMSSSLNSAYVISVPATRTPGYGMLATIRTGA